MKLSTCHRSAALKVQGGQVTVRVSAKTTPLRLHSALRPSRSSVLRRTTVNCSKVFKSSLSDVNAVGRGTRQQGARVLSKRSGVVCYANENSDAVPQEECLPKENVALENETPKNTNGKAKGLFKALRRSAIVCATLLLTAMPAVATTGVVAADSAWVLTSTALVLFMTLPGLAAFYAGLVKRKNLLSVLIQCFAIACVQTLLWVTVGYSLSFSTFGMEEGVRGLASFIGGLDKIFLNGMSVSSVTGTIPEALWCMFQMTFAIITPALMVGSVVERMKFNAVLIYTTLWSLLVYFPFCHMVWGGAGGLMADLGVLDFAGGIVVHITAGIGALVAAIVCGPRKENELTGGNLTLTFLGTGMLWVGWFGFNGGSAVAAGAEAAFAILATQISAATAAIMWMVLDILESGKASMIGILTGAVAGLATITPASGFVGPIGGACLGAIGAIICRYFSTDIKSRLGYDDSLDVFGVHGVGGFVGTCMLGVFAAPMFGGFGTTPMLQQTIIQVAAAVATVIYTAPVSWLCLKVTAAICGGLRIPDGVETSEGLDVWCHGEKCIRLDPQ